MSEKVKLGSLWAREAKSGKVFFTGPLNDGLRLLMFPVEKKNDKQPDFELFLTPNLQAGDGKATYQPPVEEDDGFPDTDD